jgi:hypothetical protein
MNQTLSLSAFACIFGGMLIGMALRALLPEHHLSDESKDAVKLGTGMIATLAALVLGLLIASAKGTFDTMTNDLRQSGSRIVLLDRVMAQYGPETKEARDDLRRGLASVVQRIWPEETHAVEITAAQQPGDELEAIQDKLRQLSPRNDAQRWLQSRALQISADIAEGRWFLLGGSARFSPGTLPRGAGLLAHLIFASFGLFSPRNGTVIVVMFICALSTAAALTFLILELDQPYQGLIFDTPYTAPSHVM